MSMIKRVARTGQRSTFGQVRGSMIDRETLKRQAAEAALRYVCQGDIIGVGAGSTVEHFIRAIARSNMKPQAAVAASNRTRALLEAHTVAVVGLTEETIPLALYIDGADEVDTQLRLIKGGGGAAAREKIIASASELFVCIVDESKLVDVLGTASIPVEIVPMALHLVERDIRRLGGTPVLRDSYETDNGNWVLDVSGLDLRAPEELERTIDALPGVVECGIFARRRADVVIVGTQGGVRRLTADAQARRRG